MHNKPAVTDERKQSYARLCLYRLDGTRKHKMHKTLLLEKKTFAVHLHLHGQNQSTPLTETAEICPTQ